MYLINSGRLAAFDSDTADVRSCAISQAIDLQQFSFFVRGALPMADYLHPCHRRLLLTNLKFIIYENDKHRPASDSSNDLVRPVLTTNINGAG
jgi:hypothetical protein